MKIHRSVSNTMFRSEVNAYDCKTNKIIIIKQKVKYDGVLLECILINIFVATIIYILTLSDEEVQIFALFKFQKNVNFLSYLKRDCGNSFEQACGWSLMYILQQKLKNLKPIMRVWIKNNFGDVHDVVHP